MIQPTTCPATMSGGWDPLGSLDWLEIAAALPLPWPEAACRHDLRWHAARERVAGVKLPGRVYFAARWGREDWATRLIFRSDWRDPRFPAPESNRDPTAIQPPNNHAPTTEVPANAENLDESNREPTAIQPPNNQPPPSRGSLLTDHRSQNTHLSLIHI